MGQRHIRARGDLAALGAWRRSKDPASPRRCPTGTAEVAWALHLRGTTHRSRSDLFVRVTRRRLGAARPSCMRKEPLMIRAKYAAWPILAGALLCPLLIDCGAAKDFQELSGGCNEVDQGVDAVGKLNVDANVKAMATASAELKASAARIKIDVKAACVDVCNRLGIED